MEEIKKYASDIRDLPLWLKYMLAVATIFGVLGTLFGVWSAYVRPTNQEIVNNRDTLGNATSTISLSDMFTKANNLESVIERQDFLKKYIGSKIYGEGPVTEVSRFGDGYVIDIKIAGHLVSCQLSSNEENEKKVFLLKGKNINLSGIFTFTNIFEHGLIIENCVF